MIEFERNLLCILQYLLHRAPLEQTLPLFKEELPAPRRLSRHTIELIQELLRKGCTQLLAGSDAWQRTRFLRGDRIAEGRLWERTSPAELGLTFSGHTLSFLIWVTATNVCRINAISRVDGQRHIERVKGPLTTGDRLFLFFAYASLRATTIATTLRIDHDLASEGLLRLAFPDDFADAPDNSIPGFSYWLSPERAWIVEALQSRLSAGWQGLAQPAEPSRERAESQQDAGLQSRLLKSFLDSIEVTGRRDLARFLLHAAEQLLRNRGRCHERVDSQEPRGAAPLAHFEPAESVRALLNQFERLRQWARAARNVGYLDDGYAESQLWKEEWEACDGERLYSQVGEIIASRNA